jgi:hypothetical protein
VLLLHRRQWSAAFWTAFVALVVGLGIAGGYLPAWIGYAAAVIQALALAPTGAFWDVAPASTTTKARPATPSSAQGTASHTGPMTAVREIALAFVGAGLLIGVVFAVIASGAPGWLTLIAGFLVLLAYVWLRSRLEARGPTEVDQRGDDPKPEPAPDSPPSRGSGQMTDDRGEQVEGFGRSFLYVYFPAWWVVFVVVFLPLNFIPAIATPVSLITAASVATAAVGVLLFVDPRAKLGPPRSRAAIADTHDWDARGEDPVCGGVVVWTDGRCTHCGTALDPAERRPPGEAEPVVRQGR